MVQTTDSIPTQMPPQSEWLTRLSLRGALYRTVHRASGAEAELPADCQMIAAACGVSVNGPFLLQGYSITDVSGQNSASRYFLQRIDYKKL